MKLHMFSQKFTTRIVAILCFLSSFSAIAAGVVSGKIADKSGNPLIAASVSIVGTKTGVYTEADGTYKLQLQKGSYKIEFAYIGYKTELRDVFVVDGKTITLNVQLQADAQQISAVVKMAYGSQKKEDVFPVIRGNRKSRQMDMSQVSEVMESNKVAGVQVRSNSGTPGAGMDIVVRGRGTTGDARPLYVVDGVPVGYEYKGNPNDIKSISILKDASSCAMYGSRGANGVVIISTNGNNILPIPQDIEQNTEEYASIKENDYSITAVNQFSTFSIDVDRASYANVRRFINQGTKPYTSAVRYEEMINYFSYNYPQPKEKDPFSITVEKNICPWNSKHQLVLVGLQGKTVEQKNIPASNLVFLIDVSGSMQVANKLPLVKESMRELVSNLREIDRVSIVVYAGNAGLVLSPTSGAQKDKIMNAINSLEAGGSTAGGEGILLAYKTAEETYIHGGNNRIVLASDGDFNVGVSSTGELVQIVEEKRKKGIYLSVLGFGMGNYKDNRMEEISNKGNGNYAYIDSKAEAEKIFGKEFWGTMFAIANDVKIQVEFNPAIVKSYRLIGYENRMLETEDFVNDKKDAGEVGSGHSVTALYEVVMVDNEKTNDQQSSKYVQQSFINSSEMMTVNVRYKNPGDTSSIPMSKSISKEEKSTSTNLVLASSVAEFGMLLRNSEFKENASYDAVLERLQLLNNKNDKEIAELQELVKKSKGMM